MDSRKCYPFQTIMNYDIPYMYTSSYIYSFARHNIIIAFLSILYSAVCLLLYFKLGHGYIYYYCIINITYTIMVSGTDCCTKNHPNIKIF